MEKSHFYGKMLADMRSDERLDLLRIDTGEEAAFRVWFASWCLAAACSANGQLIDKNGPIDTRRFAAMEHFDIELVKVSFAAMVSNKLATLTNEGIYTILNWDWEPAEEKARASGRARSKKHRIKMKAKKTAAALAAAAASPVSSIPESDDIETETQTNPAKASRAKKMPKGTAVPVADTHIATKTKANISSLPDNTVNFNLAGYKPESIERILGTVAEETGEGQEITTQFINHDREYDDRDRSWLDTNPAEFQTAAAELSAREPVQRQPQEKPQSKEEPAKAQAKQTQEPAELANISHDCEYDEMEWMADTDPSELAMAATESSAWELAKELPQANGLPAKKAKELAEPTSYGDRIDDSNWRQLRIVTAVPAPATYQ